MLARRREIALVAQQVGEKIVSRRKRRIDRDGLAAMRDRLVRLAKRAISLRDRAVIGGDAVVRVDRLLRSARPPAPACGLQRDHAEEVQAIELARIDFEDAAVELLGLAELAVLMTPERKLKKAVDPRGVARAVTVIP